MFRRTTISRMVRTLGIATRAGRACPCLSCLLLATIGMTTFPGVLRGEDDRSAAEHRFVTTYTYYDEEPLAGLVKTRTDAAERVTKYSYNDRRQLRKIEYADGTSVEYVYDKLGRRVAMKDWTGTTKYKYDTLNRLVRVDQSNGLWAKFEYDWLNRIAAIITPKESPQSDEGWRVEYKYDLMGRLANIDSPVGRFTWEYDLKRSILTRSMPNGITSSAHWNTAGRLAKFRHERVSIGRDGRAVATLIAEFGNTYDPHGRVASETELTARHKFVSGFTYDALGRLVEASLPADEIMKYCYDGMGNRISDSTSSTGSTGRQHDRYGCIIQAGDHALGYDKVGSVTWRRDQGGTTRFGYDPAGRLVSFATKQARVTYDYNGDGALISRDENGRRSHFLVFPFSTTNVILYENDHNGRASHTISYRRPLCRVFDDQPAFFLEDRLGSLRVVADAQGRVVRRLSYSPFGKQESTSPPPAFGVAYAGMPYDSVTQLMLTRTRAYDPTSGRFLQVEPRRRVPFGANGDVQLYAYCANDPVNRVDRDGRDPTTDWATDMEMDGILDTSHMRGLWQNRLLASRAEAGYRAGLVGYDSATVVAEVFAPPAGKMLSIGRTAISAAEEGLSEKQAMMATSQEVFSRTVSFAKDEGLISGWVEGLSGAVGMLGSVTQVIESYTEFTDAQSRVTENLGPMTMTEPVHSYLPDSLTSYTEITGQVENSYEHLGGITYGYEPGLSSSRQVSEFRGTMIERELASYTDAEGDLWVRMTRNGRAHWEEVPSHIDSTERLFAWHDFHQQNMSFGESLQDQGYVWDQGALRHDPTRVGGVRLDRTAQVLGDVGQITALRFDEESGRLMLLGERGNTNLPAMRLDDLATVIRSIYVEGVDPFVSIDPQPGDIYGPKMDIRYSPGLLFTHAGGAMYRADYKMKEYAAGGRGSQRLQTSVKGWKCLADLEEELFPKGRQRDRKVWYRFWIKPKDITLTLAPDGKSMVFERASVRLETENMVLKEGRLQRVENFKDPVAEAFAKQFTERYDELAEEYAPFEEVRQLAQMVGLVKWMHERSVEVDLTWVDRHSSGTENTPLETDSIWAEPVVRKVDGTLSGERMHFYFGGVELGMRLKQQRLTAGQSLPRLKSEDPNGEDHRRLARSLAQLQSLMKETPTSNGRETWEAADDPSGTVRGAVVPGVARRVLGAYRTRAVDLALADDGQHLSLVRHCNSLFNEPTAFGRGWSLLLPRLYRRQPLPGEQSVVIPGQDGQQRTLPVIVLTNDLGSFEHRLHPDPRAAQRGRISYLAPAKGGIRRIIVEPNAERTIDTVRVEFHNRSNWQFDQAGYVVAQDAGASKQRYVWEPLKGGSQRLRQVVCQTANKKPLALELNYDANDRVRLVTGSDGSQVEYVYNDDGDLSEVRGPLGKLAYTYETNHLLNSVRRNGELRESITYDNEGRIDQLLGSDEERRADFDFQQQSDGNLSITNQEGGGRLTYNSRLQLVAAENGDRHFAYAYYPDGSPRNLIARDGADVESRVEFSEGGDRVTLNTPTGATIDYGLDSAGKLRSTAVNDQKLGEFEYDAASGQLERASFPTFQVGRKFRGDQLVEEVIEPRLRWDSGSRRQRDQLKFAYADGRLTSVRGPGGLEFGFGYAGDRLETVSTSRQQLTVKDNGQTRTVTSSDGRSISVERSESGEINRVVETVGDSQRVVTYEEGRVRRVKNFDDGVTEYQWDKETGVLKSVKDALDGRISYEYKEVAGQDRLAVVTLPNKRTIEFDYDDQGRVTQIRE